MGDAQLWGAQVVMCPTSCDVLNRCAVYYSPNFACKRNIALGILNIKLNLKKWFVLGNLFKKILRERLNLIANYTKLVELNISLLEKLFTWKAGFQSEGEGKICREIYSLWFIL